MPLRKTIHLKFRRSSLLVVSFEGKGAGEREADDWIIFLCKIKYVH